MNDHGRRIVVDLGFEAAAGATGRAIREEGFKALARVDVRDHFWRNLGHDFRQYFLIQAWSPDLAFEALKHDLDAGTVLATTFAVYELADGESAIVATPHFQSIAAEPEWRLNAPGLAAIADEEGARVARVLARVQQAARNRKSAASAA